jgi:hypothetical protein
MFFYKITRRLPLILEDNSKLAKILSSKPGIVTSAPDAYMASLYSLDGITVVYNRPGNDVVDTLPLQPDNIGETLSVAGGQLIMPAGSDYDYVMDSIGSTMIRYDSNEERSRIESNMSWCVKESLLDSLTYDDSGGYVSDTYLPGAFQAGLYSGLPVRTRISSQSNSNAANVTIDYWHYIQQYPSVWIAPTQRLQRIDTISGVHIAGLMLADYLVKMRSGVTT